MPGSLQLEKTYVPSPNTARGQPSLLDISPKGDFLIYANGKANIAEGEIYYEHKVPVTYYLCSNILFSCARFSPSGYFIASGGIYKFSEIFVLDSHGNVRVWSYDNPEHPLKVEVHCFGLEVKDIRWDSESKRIIAVGKDKTRPAKVFGWDTGSNIGELIGCVQEASSCDFRPIRPFRLVTSSQDFKIYYYSGPPFKFTLSNSEHTNFINSVRFSPDGKYYVSVSSDSTINLYDASEGTFIKKIVDEGKNHDGGIYGVDWSKDNKIVTVSADRSAKIWDIEESKCLYTLQLDNKSIDTMLTGVVWKDDVIYMISLVSDIYIWKAMSEEYKIIQSHQVEINNIVIDNGTLYSASYDGVICKTSLKESVCNRICKHNGNCTNIGIMKDYLVSIGWDNVVYYISKTSNEIVKKFDTNKQQPLSLSCCSNRCIYCIEKELIVLNEECEIYVKMPLKYQATCVEISKDGNKIIVGGNDINNEKSYTYYLYDISDPSKVNEIEIDHDKFKHTGRITALSFDGSGNNIAIGDDIREIRVMNLVEKNYTIMGRWLAHTSKITSLEWNRKGDRIVSSAISGEIYIWNPQSHRDYFGMKMAHVGGVTCVRFDYNTDNNDEDSNVLYSCGCDNCVKKWSITYPI